MIAPYMPPEAYDPRAQTGQVAVLPLTEAELLDLMRKHCQKSWQATRWLLEMQFPQRYGKRKANADPGPNSEGLFNALGIVLAEEIADEALRGRITARLDALAAEPIFNRPARAAESKASHPAAAELQPINNGDPAEHLRHDERPQQHEHLATQEDPPTNHLQTPEAGEPVPTAVDQPASRDAAASTGNLAGRQGPLAIAPTPLTPLAVALDSPRPPPTWMEQARQQNEEKKRLRKERNQTRAQHARLRSQAKRGKKPR